MKRIVWAVSLLLVIPLGCNKSVSHPIESQPTTPGTSISESAVSEVERPIVSEIEREDVKVQEPVEVETVKDVEVDFEDLGKQAFDHEVRSGESLSEIAAQYDVGIGLLMRLNQIQDANKIRVGRKIKVIQGPFRIVIQKKEKTLSVFLKDQHLKTYDVAVGKSNSTPEGSFKVMVKMVEPVWTDPYFRDMVKAGDPRYPLGTRWIQFAEYGYGIHGTNDPASIKTEASFGCIRMLNPDVEELYDWVTIGSEVQVVP